MIVRPFPRARCLTLALAANAAGPGRHSWFTNVTLGGPLATRARALTSHYIALFSCNPTVAGDRTTFARASQASRNLVASLLNLNGRFAPDARNQPGLTEPTLALTRLTLPRP